MIVSVAMQSSVRYANSITVKGWVLLKFDSDQSHISELVCQGLVHDVYS